MARIYYTKPSITPLEVAYATDAAQNGWGDRCYQTTSERARQFLCGKRGAKVFAHAVRFRKFRQMGY